MYSPSRLSFSGSLGMFRGGVEGGEAAVFLGGACLVFIGR